MLGHVIELHAGKPIARSCGHSCVPASAGVPVGCFNAGCFNATNELLHTLRCSLKTLRTPLWCFFSSTFAVAFCCSWWSQLAFLTALKASGCAVRQRFRAGPARGWQTVQALLPLVASGLVSPASLRGLAARGAPGALAGLAAALTRWWTWRSRRIRACHQTLPGESGRCGPCTLTRTKPVQPQSVFIYYVAAL